MEKDEKKAIKEYQRRVLQDPPRIREDLISPIAGNFGKSILVRNPQQRPDLLAIKKMQFFKNICWSLMLKRGYAPPLKFNSDDINSENFDKFDIQPKDLMIRPYKGNAKFSDFDFELGLTMGKHVELMNKTNLSHENEMRRIKEQSENRIVHLEKIHEERLARMQAEMNFLKGALEQQQNELDDFKIKELHRQQNEQNQNEAVVRIEKTEGIAPKRQKKTSKNVRCDECMRNFSDRFALWKHKRSFHKNFTFNCQQCHKTYTSKQMLKHHVVNVHASAE